MYMYIYICIYMYIYVYIYIYMHSTNKFPVSANISPWSNMSGQLWLWLWLRQRGELVKRDL